MLMAAPAGAAEQPAADTATNTVISAAAVDGALLTKLGSIVQATIQDRLETLTSAKSAKCVSSLATRASNLGVGIASEVSSREQMVASDLLQTKRLAANNHAVFTSSSTVVSVDSWSMSNSTLSVEMVETTSLAYKPSGSTRDPDISFRQPHLAVFQNQNGSWVLTELSTIGDRSLDAPQAPTSLAGLDETSARLVNKVALDSPVSASAATASPANTSSSTLITPAATGIYNRSAAASYAQAWALGYNPAYVHPGNDCMNFASQVLAAGGWVQVGGTGSGLGRSNTTQWYYDGLISSYSWTVSDYWASFAINQRHRAQTTTDGGTQPGDLVQFDWAPNNGGVEHTMIMTSRNSYGQILLAGHTNARRDYPLWTVQLDNPGAITLFRHIIATN